MGRLVLTETPKLPRLINTACYCHYVPRMDPTRALDSRLEPNAWDITNQVIDSMKQKFRIANVWSIELGRVKAYYTRKRKEFKNAGGSPDSTASDNGGGLTEYSMHFEEPHKEFGSLRHQKTDLTQPNDKPYSKLEHEEEPEDSAAAQSPDVSFKTEGEEPRRSNSASTSINSSAFTPVNPNNSTTPMRMEAVNGASGAPEVPRSPYGPSVSQGPQQPQPSQPYPNQSLNYEQSSSYDYTASTPAYSQPASQYNHHTSYAQASGPSQGQGNGTYDAQAMARLEEEGKRSFPNTDLTFFECSFDLPTNPMMAPEYPYNQFHPPSQFMPDSQGSYMYPEQWPGSG